MEQGENMTPEQVRNKSEVNFRLQGGSVDVNPAQKCKLMCDLIFLRLMTNLLSVS